MIAAMAKRSSKMASPADNAKESYANEMRLRSFLNQPNRAKRPMARKGGKTARKGMRK